MAMKLGKRHMQIAIVVMLAALTYRVFISARSSPAGTPAEQPLLAGVQAPARSDAPRPAAPAVADPSKIPAPSPVDLAVVPSWARDPFLGSGETRDPVAFQPTAAPEPVGPDPVVTSILYASDRRVAMVDHRMVHVGDTVSGGVVVAIEPKAIVIRTPSGAERRVEMGRGSAGRGSVGRGQEQAR